ncbi:MAG: phosphatidylglycerophosphatase A family protein [Thiobacillus sp.]
MTTSPTDTLASPTRPSFKWMLSHPAHIIALGFGSGLTPKAPGTMGTLLGIPVFLLMQSVAPNTPDLVALLIASFILGVWASAVAGRNLGVPDHGAIVWDEIAAFGLVLLFTPASWLWYGLAFAVFRFFDILKPWPIRQCDVRFKNGFGVMFDDLLAAIYSVAVMKGVQWLV